MFSKTKYSLIVVAIALLFSISGVFAVWVYAEGVISPVEAIVGVDLFEWLPGMGTEGDTEGDGEEIDINTAGTNHAAAVAELFTEGSSANLNEESSTLNSNIKAFINKIEGDISSSDNITGGQMKHVFPQTDKNSTKNLGLVLQFGKVENGKVVGLNGETGFDNFTLYYMYTFNEVEINNKPWTDTSTDTLGTNVVVWRTAINKVNNKWQQGSSEVGYAPKIRGEKGDPIIDCTKWIKGEIPTT